MTPACFAFGRYDSASGAKCISNLLAAGFRRLEIDLYWDVSRTTWSFCPVELGEVQPQLSITQASTTSQTQVESTTLAAEELGGTSEASPLRESEFAAATARLRPRQTDTEEMTSLSRSSRSLVPASTFPSATTTQTLVDDSSAPGVQAPGPQPTDVPNDGTLLSVGGYICSTQLDFHAFMQILHGHFLDTEDNLNATTKYLIMNLHAAAPASDSDSSGSSPSDGNLPQGNNMLSSLIAANNSEYLYTPQALADQRADLNQPGSWLTVSPSDSPDTAYYDVNSDNNIDSTADGWPSESVVEFARAKRLFAGFGHIDSEMEGYNRSADASTIFPPDYIESPRDVTYASNGSITNGCIFNPDADSVESANNSWAITGTYSSDLLPADASLHLAQASNLTDCGISAVLNSTLSNTTADTDPLPYKSYALATIWSWADNEPQPPDNSLPDTNPATLNRCAVLNATTSRWQAHDCGASHHAACRVSSQPYTFRISDASAAYAKAGDACRGTNAFTASRSALENAYLSSAWRSYRAENAVDDELLWVDFNDLDVVRCWVIGQNGTCPYQAQQAGEGRTIVVPTVAAVIVFVLALLTVFIKCAANRRNTRRRRKRGDDGWDYEGVPS